MHHFYFRNRQVEYLSGLCCACALLDPIFCREYNSTVRHLGGCLTWKP